MPAPPDRPTRLPHDAELPLGQADRGAGVVGCLAVEPDGLAKLGRLPRLAQLDEKLGSLVFLHAKVALPVRRLGGRDMVTAGEPVFRCGEAAGERAVAVGLDVEPLDLLAIWVAQHDAHRASRNDFVIVLGLVPREGDALELKRLAGPIDRAVGEKHHRLPRFGFVNLSAPVIISSGRADLPSVVLHEEKFIILVFGFLKSEHP